MLYAQDRWSLLLVFQAMDAAGKDGTIKHVMSGVNPQGCQVSSFKQPSSEELDHDFMWRYVKCLPERGRIGIFNRSYYEEVLVVRVHPEHPEAAEAAPGSSSASVSGTSGSPTSRLRGLSHPAGDDILKFFLHVSRKEQKKRFLERLDEPEKNWKFSAVRREGARVLGRLHARVRGGDPGDGVEARAVVRRACRQQVVHSARGRRGDRGRVGGPRPHIPETQRRRKSSQPCGRRFPASGRAVFFECR